MQCQQQQVEWRVDRRGVTRGSLVSHFNHVRRSRLALSNKQSELAHQDYCVHCRCDGVGNVFRSSEADRL